MHGLIRINVFIDADKRFTWQRIGIKNGILKEKPIASLTIFF